MNNLDRVAEEIRRQAERTAPDRTAAHGPGRPTTDELVHFLLEVVNLEDIHAKKPRNVNQEVETMLRALARPQSDDSRGGRRRREC